MLASREIFSREFGAALIKHVFEGLQACSQHFLDRVAVVKRRDHVSALSRNVSATALLRRNCVGYTRPVCSSFATTSPPRSERS